MSSTGPLRQDSGWAPLGETGTGAAAGFLLLGFSKGKIEARAVTEVALVVVVSGAQVLKPRQEILQLDGPEVHMLGDLDVQPTADSHAKAAFRPGSTQEGPGRS